MKIKSITILFPIHGLVPRGGMKVAYEYANRLCRDGYQVHIAYPALPYIGHQTITQIIRTIIKYFFFRFIKGYSCRKWFPLEKNIQEHYIYTLTYKYVPKTDLYMATSVETAMYLTTYSEVPLEKKLYLIQGYENWAVSDECVRKTYTYGFKNIVISHWLAEIVSETGAKYTLVKNGFDFDYFKMHVPINARCRLNISMMYSTQQGKGCDYGFKALSIVKKEYPALKVSLFGVHPKPQHLPIDNFEYYQLPNRDLHNRIYNESAIFLAPNIMEEGWGLPVGEAMICGCAVVCTDNKGFREMAEDGVSALLSPIRNAQSLAENIMRLIRDDEFRIRLAEQGHDNIRQFSWDVSYQKLKTLL